MCGEKNEDKIECKKYFRPPIDIVILIFFLSNVYQAAASMS